MKDFNQKVVVITGGATGIGFAFAKAMGLEGAKVVIASRRVAKVEESVNKLRDLGIEASGTSCDVSIRKDVERLKEFTLNTYGTVDVLMNNAGITQQQMPVLNTDVGVYRKIFEINYFGVIHCTQVFAEVMLEKDSESAIYNVGSENSLFLGVPQASAYISSKHALVALTEALKEEMPKKVGVSLIIPGLVQSELADGFIPGMDTDQYVEVVMEQLKNDEFYCVSHARNIVRIKEQYNALEKAYATYAPRYENDDEFDVRIQIEKLLGKES